MPQYLYSSFITNLIPVCFNTKTYFVMIALSFRKNLKMGVKTGTRNARMCNYIILLVMMNTMC